MTPLIEAVPALGDYHKAFAVLAALSLVTLIQNFATAPFAFANQQQTPGMPLQFDHSVFSFRVVRTYANSVEALPMFGWPLLVAVIAGAPPGLVNGLACAYFVCRIAFWAVYYAGIGKPAGGPRTLVYVGGLLANIALAFTALWAVFA